MIEYASGLASLDRRRRHRPRHRRGRLADCWVLLALMLRGTNRIAASSPAPYHCAPEADGVGVRGGKQTLAVGGCCVRRWCGAGGSSACPAVSRIALRRTAFE